MKHFHVIRIGFAIIVILALLSCVRNKEKNITSNAAIEQKVDYNYTDLGKSVKVFDDQDSLVGFLIMAKTDFCGSDCKTAVLFLKIDANKGFTASDISSLGSLYSMGYDFCEKNKNIFRSSFIWKEGESHFGCHYFKVEKVKYVNGKFELTDEFITKEQYCFDEGEANGKCKVFPGVGKILEENGH